MGPFAFSTFFRTEKCLTLLTDFLEQSLLEKLVVPHLGKKLPAFYGTQSFITAFKIARHLSLS